MNSEAYPTQKEFTPDEYKKAPVVYVFYSQGGKSLFFKIRIIGQTRESTPSYLRDVVLKHGVTYYDKDRDSIDMVSPYAIYKVSLMPPKER